MQKIKLIKKEKLIRFYSSAFFFIKIYNILILYLIYLIIQIHI